MAGRPVWRVLLLLGLMFGLGVALAIFLGYRYAQKPKMALPQIKTEVPLTVQTAGSVEPVAVVNQQALAYWLQKLGYLGEEKTSRVVPMMTNQAYEVKKIKAVFSDQQQPDFQVLGQGGKVSSLFYSWI